jgi:hypothetical protein
VNGSPDPDWHDDGMIASNHNGIEVYPIQKFVFVKLSEKQGSGLNLGMYHWKIRD